MLGLLLLQADEHLRAAEAAREAADAEHAAHTDALQASLAKQVKPSCTQCHQAAWPHLSLTRARGQMSCLSAVLDQEIETWHDCIQQAAILVLHGRNKG